MKTKFKYVTLMAAALLVGFTSCSNDEEGGSKPENGTPTKMSLAITQPVTYAADPNATTAETEIKTVDVYIYSNLNAFIKREHLSVSDFTETPAGSNTWKLNAGNEITTTVGQKNIYVGVNLPASLASAIEGTDPATAEQAVTAASQLGNSTTGFAMFSRLVQTPTLVAPSDPTYATDNSIKVTVARLFAKVFVEKGATLPADPIALTGGTIQGLKFAVSNINKKFFPYPSATFQDPNWTSPWANLSDFIPAVAADYLAVNPNGTAVNAVGANSIYTTENTSQGVIEDEHTYASISGVYVPANIVKLVTPGVGTSGVTPDAAITAGTTFYRVIVAGLNYFFSDLTDATAYAAANSVSMDTYTNGVAYYNVFLNPAPTGGENKYDVLRNTIYSVKITKVNGLGNPQNGGGGGSITDPTEISVEVDIEAWRSSSQDAEL